MTLHTAELLQRQASARMVESVRGLEEQEQLSPPRSPPESETNPDTIDESQIDLHVNELWSTTQAKAEVLDKRKRTLQAQFESKDSETSSNEHQLAEFDFFCQGLVSNIKVPVPKKIFSPVTTMTVCFSILAPLYEYG